MGKGDFRSVIFRLHKWLGLNLVIIFAMLFASGTVLVVSDELSALMHPKTLVNTPENGQLASFGTIYDRVQDSYPTGTIFLIQRQPQPWIADRTYMNTGWGERVIVWTDPTTAQVLDVTRIKNFRSILREFHESLLVPRRIAFILVTSTSFLLLYLTISGLITYRRFWKGFFRRPTNQLGARGYQAGLHRLLGLWTAVFLIIISLTSIYYFTGGLGVTGYSPEPEPASDRQLVRPAGFDGALIDAAELKAKEALPGLLPVVMMAPARPTDGIRFIGPTGDEGPLVGENLVSVDPKDMKILGVIRPYDKRGNARIKALMDGLHFGTWGGVASRVAWVFLGAASLWLFLSGAKVFVARASHLPGAKRKQGDIRRFMQGMKLVKWVYLLLILGVIGISVIRYGPGSEKWAGIAPLDGSAQGVKMRILGPLRAGEQMELMVTVAKGTAMTATIEHDGIDNTPLAIIEQAANGGRIGFRTPAQQSGNRFKVVLITKTGDQKIARFDLGSAIW